MTQLTIIERVYRLVEFCFRRNVQKVTDCTTKTDDKSRYDDIPNMINQQIIDQPNEGLHLRQNKAFIFLVVFYAIIIIFAMVMVFK